jgi:ATP-dependent DNA ligase
LVGTVRRVVHDPKTHNTLSAGPFLTDSHFATNFLSSHHAQHLRLLPSYRATTVPHTPDWLHEIKYDGYRLRLERDGGRVRLITKGGHNWTSRYPWIVEAALKNRHKQFVIDGEAVILKGRWRVGFQRPAFRQV